MSNQHRQPSGSSRGGQFAPDRRSSPVLTLASQTSPPPNRVESATTALEATCGVTVDEVTAVDGGVNFSFTDADGHWFHGQVIPGFRAVSAEHPSAEFSSITFIGDTTPDPVEQVRWLGDTARRSVRGMAAVHAWERTGDGGELPRDGAFTVEEEPDGTVRSWLLVGCDGFDAEVTHTRGPDGAASLAFAMSDDSPYVPPHLREVVDAGLPAVVTRQSGQTIDALSARMDAAAQLTLRSRAYRG